MFWDPISEDNATIRTPHICRLLRMISMIRSLIVLASNLSVVKSKWGECFHLVLTPPIKNISALFARTLDWNGPEIEDKKIQKMK